MNLYKSTKLGVIVIGALSILFFIWVSASSEQIRLDFESGDTSHFGLTLFLIMGYLSMILSVVFVLYFIFKAVFEDKTKLKKALIYSGVTLLIIIVTYFISDDTAYEKYNIGTGYSKLISTGLNLFYITGLATIVALLYTSFKKKNY